MTTTTVPATSPSPSSASAAVTGDPLLELRGLVKHFPVRGEGLLRRRQTVVRAVDGISL